VIGYVPIGEIDVAVVVQTGAVVNVMPLGVVAYVSGGTTPPAFIARLFAVTVAAAIWTVIFPGT
jgi:hypothetical protein